MPKVRKKVTLAQKIKAGGSPQLSKYAAKHGETKNIKILTGAANELRNAEYRRRNAERNTA